MHASELQQRGVARRSKNTDAYDFFNLLTSERLLTQVEAHLPPHRKRLYTLAETLSMFLAPVLVVKGNGGQREMGDRPR